MLKARRMPLLALGLVALLPLGACGGGDAGGAADDAGAMTTGDEAAPATGAAATEAPAVDVCGLLDTDALVAAMPQPEDGGTIQVESQEGAFGPQCSFRGGRATEQLTARVSISPFSKEEALAIHPDVKALPDVGDGVESYVNPNFSDQRSYVFDAQGRTFDITTEFEDEAASREFARRAVAMLRG